MFWCLIVLLPIAVVVWLFYEWLEHRFVRRNSTTVECQKLPAGKEIKLCLISDLHNNRKKTGELMQYITGFAPDMVLLAGDFVNKHKEENPHALDFLKELSLLHIPVYYSQGNHELSMAENNPGVWQKYLSAIPENVVFLDNASVLFPPEEKICISGLSLPTEFYKKGSLFKDTDHLPQMDIPENEFHILMAHNPEYADLYKIYKADFIVAGHLHGGLLRLPWIGGVVSPRLRLINGCDAGLVELPEKGHLFVSRGIGSHTIPLRFFNRAEMNFLVLKSK